MSRPPWMRDALTAGAVTLLVVGPTVPNALWRGNLGLCAEAALLVGAWYALTLVGTPPSAEAKAWRRVGSWRAWGIGLVWATLAGFEIALQVARYATNENLPLYDAALLSRHLYILGRDLYGFVAKLVVVGVAVAPVVLWALGAAAFGQLERGIGAWPRRRSTLAVGALVAAGLVSVVLPGGRWAAPRIVSNVAESWRLYRQTAAAFAERSHADLKALTFDQRPDVLIYVVESYGRVVEQDATMFERWAPAVDVMDAELQSAGWYTGSAWGVAPVQGGRSWISDAAVMFGLHLSHQSEYEHAMALVRTLPILPRAFDERGYTTLLVKPADRERPGVALDNSFGFERTVFAADLAYTGPVIGWGQIPDQYTLGFVHERVIPEIEPPVFAFFHLATSHMPWPSSPKLMAHWEDWNEAAGTKRPVFVQRTTESEVAMRLSRFKRRTREATERPPQPGQPGRYVDNVLFDLQAIAETHLAGPQRPTLIVIYGDHQPPIVADGTDPDVPVHLVASDPELLEALLGHGFMPGLRPTGDEHKVLHEDLFPILIRALAAAGRSAQAQSGGAAP